MRLLNYQTLDITGFAGIRERVLVMDRKRFRANIADDIFDAFGHCEYLAHAYFTPGGSTGTHHHSDVDIISIFTKGEVLHEGTLGDGQRFHPGQVLVQCSGLSGFRHNEINAMADISGMVQLWCRPSESSARTQSHDIIHLPEQGMCRIYGGSSSDSATKVESDTQMDIAVMAAQEVLALKGKSRVYVFEGSLEAEEAEQQSTLSRGTLCDGVDLKVTAKTTSRVLIQRLLERKA